MPPTWWWLMKTNKATPTTRGPSTLRLVNNSMHGWREHEALDAARDCVDSDDNKEIECTDDEGSEERQPPPSSVWDEPQSPLSSVLPSPTPSAPSLPDHVATHVDANHKRDEERTKELMTQWAGKKHARCYAKRAYDREEPAKHAMTAHPMETNLATHELPVALTGWIGLRDRKKDQSLYSTKQLVEDLKFHLVNWDNPTCTPVTDDSGLVVTVLLGQPNNSQWGEVVKDATGNLCDGGPEVQQILSLLIKNKGICRIAGFAASGFVTYSPRTYTYYNETMKALLTGHPSLRRNFDNSPWAAMTFNMGPQTVCFPHLDSGNLPWGWCAVTTLGQFDPDCSGHLVLWDLRLGELLLVLIFQNPVPG
ncbi:hypothetical protein EYR36_002121 [Pleurotus pulmonarius]|nr:hypothetical protein EYR36_002121 [Pleurotus pulmonarius]